MLFSWIFTKNSLISSLNIHAVRVKIRIRAEAINATAYGVTKNGDIKLHNGWNEDSYSTVSTTPFQYNNVAIWVEIKEDVLSHKCSNNYYDVATGSNICACNVYYDTHPEHTHFYHNNFDENTHWGQCICGNIINSSSHNITYINTDSVNHYMYCRSCNYEATTTHSFSLTDETSDVSHKLACICGRNVYEPHCYYDECPSNETHHGVVCECGVIYDTEEHCAHEYYYSSELVHNVYCKCGTLIGTEEHSEFKYVYKNKMLHSYICKDCGCVLSTSIHSIVNDNNRYSHCTDCGAVFDNFSDVTIKSIEDDTDTESR